MKKVDFAKLKVGDLVEVPRTQFSMTRRGWNGWLFSHAVVLDKGISKKTGRQVVKVEMMYPSNYPSNGNDYRTAVKVFVADAVFQTNALKTAKMLLKENHGDAQNREEFEKSIVENKVVGCDWMRFLADKGFLFKG
jgi:hypothetical protein